MITVIIADDDMIIREGLKLMLSSCEDIRVLGIAQDGKEALELCRELRPDVALLDIRMPKMDGIAASKRILQEEVSQPLLLTTFDEEEFIVQAFAIGVSGYILKNSPAERIMNAIRAVAAGAVVFQQDILECIQGHVDMDQTEDSCFHDLSKREMEVVRLIAEGYANQDIADKLFLSNGTVRNHVSTILEKTGLEHRTQIAVRYLNRKGV
ncbi:MAG TPA: response regulator transcription factor [Lachnospiraceae bacterium]|nr:response regulator transcription factor [Lachnospiraceae bacterium]